MVQLKAIHFPCSCSQNIITPGNAPREVPEPVSRTQTRGHAWLERRGAVLRLAASHPTRPSLLFPALGPHRGTRQADGARQGRLSVQDGVTLETRSGGAMCEQTQPGSRPHAQGWAESRGRRSHRERSG